MSFHLIPAEYVCQQHAEHIRRLAQTTHLRAARPSRRRRSAGRNAKPDAR